MAKRDEAGTMKRSTAAILAIGTAAAMMANENKYAPVSRIARGIRATKRSKAKKHKRNIQKASRRKNRA